MRDWGLRSALSLWTLSLLVAVVLALVVVAQRETQGLARSEALARAERIAARVDEAIAADLGDLREKARLLAERPTLERRIAAADRAGLDAFLESYRAGAALERIALVSGELSVEVGQSAVTTTDRSLPLAVAGDRLVGSASVDGPRGSHIVVEGTVHWHAEELAAPGLPIRILTRSEVDAAVGGERVALRRAALATGRAAGFDPVTGAATAGRALAGDPSPGLIEVEIPGTEVRAPARRFALRLGAAALGIGAIALLLALLLADRLARPIRELTEAARSLGGGDLALPLALPRGGGEVATLAATLERMRRNLHAARGESEASRGELQAVLAGVSDGVFAVDRDRRLRYLSPAAASLLGVAPEQAIGRFCGDVLLPAQISGERPCESACPILQARFRGPVRANERLEAGRGSWVARIVSSTVVGGLQVQILRPETADEAARRARDAVLADLAHELRTPLAAQRASLELLATSIEASEAGAAGLIDSLEAGTMRLERLIDNLLESVRIESGELAIRRLAVDLEEVVEEAVGMAAPLAARRDQKLEIDLPFPLPRVTGDPQRLTQVLTNLLANAIKFAPAGSEIGIGGAVTADQVRLWIEDQGPGFDPQLLAGAPRRFHRGTSARGGAEPTEEGTGLGLWIARSIAERHGGSLAAERSAGRTRVTLLLPATESVP